MYNYRDVDFCQDMSAFIELLGLFCYIGHYHSNHDQGIFDT